MPWKEGIPEYYELPATNAFTIGVTLNKEGQKNRRGIKKYNYVERDEGTKDKGYVIELLSGSTIDIFIYKREGSDNKGISIDYNQKN